MNLYITTFSQKKVKFAKQGRGTSLLPLNETPILLILGSPEDEEESIFTCWMHRARHLRSLIDLRASTDVADVRLDRKLCYEHANFKFKGKTRLRPLRYAPVEQPPSTLATHVAKYSHQNFGVSLSASVITGGKVRGRKVILTTAFENINRIRAIFPKGFLSSHKLHDLRYYSTNQYRFWPWRRHFWRNYCT